MIQPAHSWTLFLINASGLVLAWTLCALTMTTLHVEPQAAGRQRN